MGAVPKLRLPSSVQHAVRNPRVLEVLLVAHVRPPVPTVRHDRKKKKCVWKSREALKDKINRTPHTERKQNHLLLRLPWTSDPLPRKSQNKPRGYSCHFTLNRNKHMKKTHMGNPKIEFSTCHGAHFKREQAQTGGDMITPLPVFGNRPESGAARTSAVWNKEEMLLRRRARSSGAVWEPTAAVREADG